MRPSGALVWPLCALVWDVRISLVRILLIAALTLGAVQGSDKITVYESDHFELITDGGKGRAQEILGQFERVRSFFTQVLPTQAPLMKPRIVVFNTDKGFREATLNEVASAYYTPLPHRDMIAISAGNRESEQQRVVHEYLHMLVRYTDSDLPLWMNEGIAELYSTIQPLGKKIQVGVPIANHLLQLRNAWLNLEEVLAVDHASPIYNRRAHAGTFYAASWALVHMLSLGDAYKSGYGQMAAGLGASKSAAEVFQTVYGKSLKQVESDLRAYVSETRMMTLVFDLKFDSSYDKIQPREVTSYEWNVARADLLTAARKYDLARQRLEELTVAEPSRPEAWESLAFLRWIARQEGSAEAYAKAVERKSTHANLLFHSRSLTRDFASIGIALQSLVDRNPNYVDGRIRLASHLLYDRQLSKSYDEIKKLKKINVRQAAHYFPVLIETSWRLNKLEECRIAASQFKQVAKSEATQESAKTWFSYAMREPAPERTEVAAVERRFERGEGEDALTLPPPPLPDEFLGEEISLDVVTKNGETRLVRGKLIMLEGVLVNLECKDPQAIVSVKTAAGITRLLIEDPTNVNLTNRAETKMELTCGPQSAKIKAGYFARENGAEKTIGALASLEFLN